MAKVLTWAIRILWIIALLLPITAAISFSTVFQQKNVSFESPSISFSDGTIIASSSFYINNAGFYDLSNVKVSMTIFESNEVLGNASRTLARVAANENVSSSIDFSLTLAELSLKHGFLLTNDTDLDLTLSVYSQIAYLLTFGVSINETTRWGAPFYNLVISGVSFNPSTQRLSIRVQFENHAYFPINGTFRLEIWNNQGELVGSSSEQADVPFGVSFNSSFDLAVDPSKVTTSGVARLYFEDAQVYEMEWTA